MIGQILKKKYEDWINSSESKNPDDFIIKVAEEHNTTPKLMCEILKPHTWFNKE